MKKKSATSIVWITRATLSGVLCLSVALWLVAARAVRGAHRAVAAATITVNNLGNSVIAGDGRCTLREAVGNANQNLDATGGDCAPGSGADVINFSVTGTLTLAASTLTITDSVTINGPGADQLTISGNNSFRPFTIAASAGDVTISNMTLANGYAAGRNGTATADAGAGQGGAIFNESAGTVNLINLTLRNNVALGGNGFNKPFGHGGAAQGGAVYHSAGTLNINNCTLTDNAVLGGKGGDIDGSAGTSARGGSGGYGQGGAVFARSAVNITGSTLENNSLSGGHGGAAAGRPAGLGGYGEGGALYLFGAPLQLASSRVGKNTVAGGTGGSASNGGCPGSGGEGYGGGIYASTNGAVKVLSTTITENRTFPSSAGGGSGACSGSGFQGSGAGAGLFYRRSIGNSALEITDSQITNNLVLASGAGGGIFTIGNVTVQITRSTIAGNSATNSGGLHVEGGLVTIEGSTFHDNEAAGFEAIQAGGAISMGDGTLSLINSTISGNRATAGSAPGIAGRTAQGGGIYHSGQRSTIHLLHTTITGNTASGGASANSGGGIASVFAEGLTSRNSIIAGNTVAGNKATGPDIGGITFSNGTYYPATLTSQGYTLLGNNSGVNVTPATGDQIGTPTMPINPMLGPLADNGGPTQTHALGTGSPAIDKGHSFGVVTDQRGRPRPYNSGQTPAPGGDLADIGAFEVQAPCAPVTLSPASLPGGLAGASYYQIISAMGGAAPYQFAVTSGSLPAGLTLAADGVLSGTLRPAGTYNFTITAHDNLGCVGSQGYSIAISCASVTASLSGGGTIRSGDSATLTVTFAGGAVPYVATLSNGGGTLTNSDPVLSFTVTPATTTTYTITSATEGNGCPVTAEGNATVTVSNDTTPPTITCPSAQTVVIAGASGAVNYPAPSVNDNYPGATFACNPPSGANFALGVTTVNCQATDAARNTAACSFTVTVRQPRPATKDLIAKVRTLVPPLTPAQANGLIGHLELANTSIERGQTAQACTHLQNFVNGVSTFISGGQLTVAQGQSLTSYANQIRNAVGCAGNPFPI